MLSHVSLARRVPQAEAWHPEFQTRAPRVKRWLCPLPQLSRRHKQAPRGSLLKMAAACSRWWHPAQDGGSRTRTAPALCASLLETQLHRNSENSLLSLADKIPAKPRRPPLFSLWGRICTLELNLEPLHSDQRMKLSFVSEPTLVSVYWLEQHGARGSLLGTIIVGGWVTELLP